MDTAPKQEFDIPRILSTVGFPSLDENFIKPILEDYSGKHGNSHSLGGIHPHLIPYATLFLSYI